MNPAFGCNPRRRWAPVKHLAVLLAFLAGLWVLPEATAQTVTFSSVTSVDEGDDGEKSVVFTVSMSARPFFTTTITFLICDGTATGGEDYRPFEGLPGQALDDRANRQVSMRFTRTNWAPKTISVPVYGDDVFEEDETIIGCLAGRGVPEGHRGTATIRNDDEPPRGGDSPEEEDPPPPPRPPALLIHTYDERVEEGDNGVANLNFRVTLTEGSPLEVTMAYATADGTASAGEDYQATSGELRFAPGETEKTVSVPVLGDLRPEADEFFTLTLSDSSNAVLARPQAVGQILNDDAALASVADAQINEGDSGAANLDFSVTLSVASDLEVTLDYATADGTARAGEDYQATSGELRFAPGETEMWVSVPVLGDATPEADETFRLRLSSLSNAELARPQATGTILNDDAAAASVADAQMNEGDSGLSNLDFSVTLSVAGDLEVTVAYATADGTAKAGEDYQAASGELRFAPGETEKRVSVPVLGDLRPEADESFRLRLSDPSNAELARPQATGTILNDDAAAASVADVRAEEGSSGSANFNFRVSLSVAGDLEVTMDYATADGTASAGSDYEAASGELRFAPGETEKTVSVPVLGDRVPEADETFSLTLSSPSNAELSRMTATGVIVDDDIEGARDRALEASLAGFGRILSRDAMSAVSERFRETPAAPGSQMVLGGQRLLSGEEETLLANQFAGWQQAGWAIESGHANGNHAGANNFAAPSFQALHVPAASGSKDPWGSRLSLGDFLQSSSFNLALAEGGEGEDEGWNLSLWGRASSGRFSGQPSTGLDSDGKLVTGYLGMDAKVGERLVAGLALAHSDGDIDYGIADFAGELDISLTSVLPYVNFQLSEKLEVWSLLGLGWGEGKFQDAVKSGGAELQDARGKLDLGLSMLAFGANRALTTLGKVEVELKSDAFAMFMDAKPKDASRVKANAQGVRLMLAGSTELMASEQERLEANLELGGRWDGGDAQTGWGTEVGGGLDYRHAGLGLGVALEGRYLLSHNARSFEEKGLSLMLEFDPGVQGRGFSLALRPAWGAHPGERGALWNDEALLRMDDRTQQAGLNGASERLDLEWGYGFGLRGGAGLLRLQGALSHEGMDQRSYRFGGFLDVPSKTRISLELNRQEGPGFKPSHGLLFKLAHAW